MRERNLRQKIYHYCGPRIRSFISKSKYDRGLRPRVDFQQSAFTAGKCHYPESYKACLVISADFELAWGWVRFKGKRDALSYGRDMALRARQNFPKLFRLFESCKIPVTWATVGHLFLEGCSRYNGKIHPEILRLPYFTNEYWRYTEGDWFDSDPASNLQAASEWYAPDLIRQILDSAVDHEIACHTFSHIDMSDERCPSQVADSELQICCELASIWEIELKSFVFPGNLVGNLPILKKHGFSAYRMEGRYELDYPQRDALGLWQIPGGVNVEKPFPSWQNEYWVDILKRYIDLALGSGTVCHFWLHPSAEPDTFHVILPEVLAYVADKSEILWCTTMHSLTRWLDDHSLTCMGTAQVSRTQQNL